MKDHTMISNVEIFLIEMTIVSIIVVMIWIVIQEMKLKEETELKMTRMIEMDDEDKMIVGEIEAMIHAEGKEKLGIMI